MQVSRDDDPLLELFSDQIVEAAENGIGDQRLDPAEVRSVGEEAAFSGKVMHRCRGEAGSLQADGCDTEGRRAGREESGAALYGGDGSTCSV